MCALRPIAMALGPLVIRDVPREIVRDGARHTWTSYSRTLCRVVVEHRVLPDLRSLRARTVLLHGRSDEEAPPGHLQDALEAAHAFGTSAELELVDGDHHLPVRRPELVASALSRVIVR
jgi:pimeloyl-ACP methyl ester carboxylesterase